jgi:amidase
LSGKVRKYKEKFLAGWNQTANDGRPIDALICPSAPGVGYPHDFNTYWGYTSLFNLIDYPAAILPISGLKVNPEQDPVDLDYVPLDTNPYDKPNHEICTQDHYVATRTHANYTLFVDDPSRFANQPITIQVVGRPFEDEELVQVSSTLDALFRGL